MEWRSLFSALHIGDIFDAIIPPRKTKEVVRNLSLERLSHIAATVRQPSDADFSYLLPYRNPEVRALVWEMKYRKNGRGGGGGRRPPSRRTGRTASAGTSCLP